MANFNEKIENAKWETLTPGQQESMTVLAHEVAGILEKGTQGFPSVMENALKQTSGILSNPRGAFQNIGSVHSAADSQNRVPAPCTDTKALAEATDRGRKPLATPLAVSVVEFEKIAQLDTADSANLNNTNQSLNQFALKAINEGGAPKLLEFVQAHNQVMRNREATNDVANPVIFNGPDSGHGL